MRFSLAPFNLKCLLSLNQIVRIKPSNLYCGTVVTNPSTGNPSWSQPKLTSSYPNKWRTSEKADQLVQSWWIEVKSKLWDRCISIRKKCSFHSYSEHISHYCTQIKYLLSHVASTKIPSWHSSFAMSNGRWL